MSENKVNKTKVYLEYICYICGDVLSGAKTTVNHVRRIHSYDIPTRAIGRKRPQNQEYQYVKDRNEPHDIEEYACPSCWFHCPKDNSQSLNEHIFENHDPIRVCAANNGEDSHVSVASEASGVARDSANRRDSQQQSSTTNGDTADTTAADISRKIDEVVNLFKKLFE